MGADRGIHVLHRRRHGAAGRRQSDEGIGEKEEPQLIIVGKQAIDDDSNQTGQMTSALLGWSQACFERPKVEGDKATVTREDRWRS